MSGKVKQLKSYFLLFIMDIVDLFPTPVGISKLKRDLNDEEIKIIEVLKKDTHINWSKGNLVTHNKRVLDIPELSDLKNIISSAINQYFTNVFKPATDMELYITQSWINVTHNGFGHPLHSHGNSLLSCVFYIDVDERDMIQFSNHNNILGSISLLTGTPHLKVFKNCMVIFPSTLKHAVPQRPDNSNGVRVSLSLNTWFRGKVGTANTMTELECL